MSAATETAAEYLAEPGIGLPHGFFTRRGGVSEGRFASLNCSLSGRDDPAAVRENRARAAAALGLPPGALFGLHQVHGIAVAVLEGAGWPPEARPEADAVVTRRRGVALVIVTAGVIGAAHAGWRGAVAGVLEATLAAMAVLGAQRSRIRAAVGPCIHQGSYEVAADLRDAVLAADPSEARFFAPGRREARWQFDLPGYCLARLARAAVAAAPSPADTLAEEARFFSHRRSTLAGGGPIGHQLSAIALPG
jgi:YfiH family protein